MISLLLALGLTQAQDPVPAQPEPTEVRAPLQSCEMTPSGWLCSYQMPAVILRGVPPGTVVLTEPPVSSGTVAPATSALPLPVVTSSAEADRQARLIARCADASWLSLCLPDDRREARALRDAANARAALRTEVSRLLSEGRCDEAVRAALAGGDMALASEVRSRNFCAPARATAEGPVDPN
jgi:hypothetical protein